MVHIPAPSCQALPWAVPPPMVRMRVDQAENLLIRMVSIFDNAHI